MKKILFLLLIATSFSCTKPVDNSYQTAKKVIIAGKIDSLNPRFPNVIFYVNRPGLQQLKIATKDIKSAIRQPLLKV